MIPGEKDREEIWPVFIRIAKWNLVHSDREDLDTKRFFVCDGKLMTYDPRDPNNRSKWTPAKKKSRSL